MNTHYVKGGVRAKPAHTQKKKRYACARAAHALDVGYACARAARALDGRYACARAAHALRMERG